MIDYHIKKQEKVQVREKMKQYMSPFNNLTDVL